MQVVWAGGLLHAALTRSLGVIAALLVVLPHCSRVVSGVAGCWFVVPLGCVLWCAVVCYNEALTGDHQPSGRHGLGLRAGRGLC